METSDCTGAFSVIFDNHVNVTEPQACTYMLVEHRLNPSEKFITTNPPSGMTYRAMSAGTVNATVVFSYSMLDQEEKISKSFLFTIYNSSLSQASSISNLNNYPVTNPIDSPLKQFNSGIMASNVICTSGFTLVIKAEDGSPACVKPNTVNILVERGWARSS